MTHTEALIALAISAFTSATILPGTSDIGLAVFGAAFPGALVSGVAVATVANTAGGLTSYALGRLVPANASLHARLATLSPTAMRWATQHGSWSLLLSWVPVVGDALCVAAGWLRLNPWQCAAAMFIGKFARYAVIAAGVAAAVAP